MRLFSQTLNPEKFSALPLEIKKKIQEKNLEGLDLSGLDLSGLDLSGVNLKKARLFKTKLKNTILTGADMRGADLTGADLTQAFMERIKAQNAGFGMANLQEARLFRADLRNSTFTKANLKKADLRCANLRMARIREANLQKCDFTSADLRMSEMTLSDVSYSCFDNADLRGSSLRMIKGYEKARWIGTDIRDINFAGAYMVRRFIMDQNYLKEFRERSKINKIIYYIWWVTSDCGRSLIRWCFCLTLQVILFAFLYAIVGIDYGKYPTIISPLYYSVVTLTTLGYGDVIPKTLGGQIIAMIQVTTGYMMLGGLISIFTNKMARRAD